MKLLHFCTSFSPVSETFIYDYIIELEKQGIDNYVLTFSRENLESRPFNKVFVLKELYKINWILIRVLNRVLGYKSSIVWYYQLIFLKKQIDKIKPDIIHAQFGPAGVIISKIAEAVKIPLMVTFHGYDISTLIRDPYWLKKYGNMFKIGQLFIGVSEHICEKLLMIGCPKEKVIKFAAGIKIENFNYREAVLNTRQEIKLIHIGRLVEKKAPLLLIKSFQLVTQYFNKKIKLKLIIIGDGPLKKGAEKLVDELELNDKVEFIGTVPHNEIRNHLSTSNIYTQHCITANDGDQEGLGVTFLEASATGLPIVTTKHNGIPDAVLDGQTGFLVPEGDYKAMADKIIELIEDEVLARKLGFAGRKHVEENYNIHTQTSKAITFYEELIK